MLGGLLALGALSVALTSCFLRRFDPLLTHPSLLLHREKAPLEMKNTAFVFIKPHANTAATQRLVLAALQSRGLSMLSEGEFTGEQIDRDMLIDQHYYAIASKATLIKAEALPVPVDKFSAAFGEAWTDVLAQNRAFNAIDAQRELGVDAAAFDALWQAAHKVKLGGGFYCAEIARPLSSSHTEGEGETKNTIYTFNGFFMSMRGKFVAPGSSIHYYVVEFDAETLSWADFRGKVLGPTDPFAAPADSLRGQILAKWEDLGLAAQPNVGDNCVHASASPFEGLAERMNWLKTDLHTDAFGAAVLAAGLSEETIRAWSRDPQVKGKSVFDQLEDKDVEDCLRTLAAMNEP